ncbi:MAG: hypothetical protein RR891_02520 [Clostridium sp.]
MFKNEILTPGEKVFKIRKRICARQEDIAGTQVTRNLISQIENDKINLTPITANFICDNINKIIEQKDIKGIEVTAEMLLEDIPTQLNRIADNYITQLRTIKLEEHKNDFLKEKILEVENFIAKWNIDYIRQAETYAVIGEIYFELEDFYESSFKMSLAIDLALKAKKYEKAIKYIINASNKLYNSGGSSLEQLRSMRAALNLYEDNNLNDHNILSNIYFNMAIHYWKLKLFENSIEYLDKVSKFNLDISKQLDVNLLKANCLEDNKQFTLAEELYINTLTVALKYSNVTIISKIYNSLGDLYRIINNKENSIKYIIYSINLKKDIEVNDYANSLYHALYNLIELDCFNLVISNYNETLEYILKSKNKNLYKDIINKLFLYCMENKEYEVIDSLLNKIEMNIKQKKICNKDIVNIFFQYCYEIKNDEKRKNVFERGINLIKVSV